MLCWKMLQLISRINYHLEGTCQKVGSWRKNVTWESFDIQRANENMNSLWMFSYKIHWVISTPVFSVLHFSFAILGFVETQHVDGEIFERRGNRWNLRSFDFSWPQSGRRDDSSRPKPGRLSQRTESARKIAKYLFIHSFIHLLQG